MSPAEVVGRAVRAIREAEGWTQDALAARLRREGLPWSRETLASLESRPGPERIRRKDLTFGEIILLARALSVDLPDLLEGPGDVEMGSTRLSLTELRNWLAHGGSQSPAQLSAEPSLSNLERGWARQLGLFPDEVRAATERLWHQTADEKIASLAERAAAKAGYAYQTALAEATREAFTDLQRALSELRIQPTEA